jgi:CPA2 family monovalent cation:H+ antiporter-2
MAGVLLLEVGAMFAGLAVISVLIQGRSISPIPFYILVGVVLNQYVVGTQGWTVVTESTFITVGAELGIVFLLFFLGLEFSLDRLTSDAKPVGTVGLLDFGLNVTMGLALGYILFKEIVPALLIAGIVYISSSAIITKTMLDTGWIANPESTPILGTLVFEDLVIAVYLAIVSVLVLGGGSVQEAISSIGIAALFMAVLLILVVAGPERFERLLETNSQEFFVLRAVGVTVLVAGVGLAIGVSEAVAAFFIGLAFGSTKYVHELEESLVSLRDVFGAVFFFWIGLLTDPFAVLGVIHIVGLAVLVSAPTKLVSGYVSGQIYDLDQRRSLRVGLALVTRGEFSLIIGGLALAGAGLTLDPATAETIYAVAVGYVLVLSILGTGLMQAAGPIEKRLFP